MYNVHYIVQYVKLFHYELFICICIFFILRLAGEQNILCIATLTAATTAAEHNAHSV